MIGCCMHKLKGNKINIIVKGHLRSWCIDSRIILKWIVEK